MEITDLNLKLDYILMLLSLVLVTSLDGGYSSYGALIIFGVFTFWTINDIMTGWKKAGGNS